MLPILATHSILLRVVVIDNIIATFSVLTDSLQCRDGRFLAGKTATVPAAAAAMFCIAKSRQDPGLAGLASHGGSGLIKGSSPNSTLSQCKNRTNHDHKVERT